MITPEYALTMARYNAWQNKQLMEIVEAMDEKALTKDRGAFFGSIQATLNHLLWGDMIWLSRINPPYPKPEGSIADSAEMWPTAAAWSADRFRCDGRIRIWAEGLGQLDLTGDLSFYSGVLDRHVVAPLGRCVVHMFNHQTHHRGQVHAMLTAAGQPAPVSDLFLMPEDA